MLESLFFIIIFIFSAAFHEYMHGYAAYRLGDTTAKDAGRLTLNPWPHLDFFGSFLLPFSMMLMGSSAIFGWAKPVPYNPNRLDDKKYGEAKVALAGPLANFLLALFFALAIRLLPFDFRLAGYLSLVVQINLVLMVFNLLPIPPLDGSKILAAFLPENWRFRYLELDRYGFILVIVFVMIFGDWLYPIINSLFRLLV
jgi:Zn-dependent protease